MSSEEERSDKREDVENNMGEDEESSNTSEAIHEEVTDFIEMMAANDRTLTDVDLAENYLTAAGADDIGAALQRNTHVTKLDLGYCFRHHRIGGDGARALAEALPHNSSLVELVLDSDDIGDDGARALAEALSANSSLARLNLNRNDIGNGGARALAEALPRNSSLEDLALGSNRISDAGARALAEALSGGSSLAELDLSWNLISHDGATALAKALSRNSSLFRINLIQNHICDDGARVLAGALPCNSALTSLSLLANGIGEDGLRALVGALKTNRTLIKLEVNGRSDDEKALREEIQRLLKCNEKEPQLMQLWTGTDFLSSTCPVLLRAAGKLCGLRAVYRLFRTRPDILQAPSVCSSRGQSLSRKRKAHS